MIDITPDTTAEQEVNVGDEVRLRWRLDAQVDPRDLTFVVQDALGNTLASYTGVEITERRVEDDGDIYWEYRAEHTVQNVFEQYEYALNDSVQTAVDTAKIKANNRLT